MAVGIDKFNRKLAAASYAFLLHKACLARIIRLSVRVGKPEGSRRDAWPASSTIARIDRFWPRGWTRWVLEGGMVNGVVRRQLNNGG